MKGIHMKLKYLFILIVLTLGIIACQSNNSTRTTVTSIQDDEIAIRQLYNQIEENWNSGNMDKIMANIADDVVQMPPGQPVVVGKEALRSAYGQFLSRNTDIWEPLIEQIVISGDLAIVRNSSTESSTPKEGGNTTTIIGKTIHVFKRGIDGSWKMIIEIWN
jgi:uncharacterized protein (TIGR02246 family)